MLRDISLVILIFVGAAILATGCASTYENPQLPALVPESEYYSEVAKYTESKKLYDGMYNKLQFSATLLNTKVSRTQADHNARIYQWDADLYANKKSEVETSLSKETKVFLSFFVPERKHDDLNKPKTLWRIFLDAGGKRYEGKAVKIKTILAELQLLYPEHNRWSTAYMVTFPVPVSMIENQETKLTMTGPVVSATAEFKP